MPNPLFSQLGIWNKAAMKVGSPRFVASDLSNPSSSSNPASLYLNDIWPYELAAFLEEHPWSFAVETVPLIPLNPPVWLASTNYTVQNYVLNGGFIYVCMIQYTSSNSFAADLAAGYWQICYPTNVPQNPPAWASNVPYVVGSAVTQGGNIYQCVVINISSNSFANDLAAGDWALVYTGSIGPTAWVTLTVYSIGQFITQSGNIYLCIVNNTSGTFATDLANGYWILQVPLSPLIRALPIMNDGCNNPYALPSDFINPYQFSAPAFYRKEEVGAPYLPVATTILMCNNPNIGSMKYVQAYPSIPSFSAKSCEALSTRLAKQLCFKISEAAQYAAGLAKQYDVDVIAAMASDSNTTSPDEAIADTWFIARLSGGTGAVGLGPDNNNVGWGVPGAGW